jgi:hypothetical protein
LANARTEAPHGSPYLRAINSWDEFDELQGDAPPILDSLRRSLSRSAPSRFCFFNGTWPIRSCG